MSSSSSDALGENIQQQVDRPNVPEQASTVRRAVGPSLQDSFRETPNEMRVALVAEFIRSSDTLAEDYDLQTIIGRLVTVCQQVAHGAEVSVVLADESDGKLSIVGSSSDRKRSLESYQLEHASGPSIDSYLSGQANSNIWSRRASFPWPEFADLAHGMGFYVTKSIPLRLRGETIGVLSIADGSVGTPSSIEDALLQALADTLTIGVLNRRVYIASNKLNDQLQSALTTRIIIEQSKGVIATRLGLAVDDAFEVLRSYARSWSLNLTDVSRAVVDGSLPAYELWNFRASPRGGPRPIGTKSEIGGRGVTGRRIVGGEGTIDSTS